MSQQPKAKFAFPSEVAHKIKDAKRVSVLTTGGERKFFPPDKLPDGCQVILDKHGEPVTMSNGSPGRPKKDPEEVVSLASELVAEKKLRRKKFLKADVLLKKARKEPDSSDFMDHIMEELAKEAAALGFEIEEAQNEGKEVSAISGRRVRVLEKLGDAWLRRQERLKSVGVVDLDTPAMKTFMEAYTEELIETMKDIGHREEGIEALLNRFAGRIDDEWKVGVRKRMKQSAQS